MIAPGLNYRRAMRIVQPEQHARLEQLPRRAEEQRTQVAGASRLASPPRVAPGPVTLDADPGRDRGVAGPSTRPGGTTGRVFQPCARPGGRAMPGALKGRGPA